MSHIKEEDARPAGFRILDLFAGPGGLDVAADVLGHRVTGIEWDKGACATRSAAGMDTFHGDVRQYRAAFFPHAQVLTGGPPCQTFTVAGHGAGRRALDEVVQYIRRLHHAVRPQSNQDWNQIFRTWRKISEELRLRELEAREVKAEKRTLEDRRAVKRKAMKSRLEELGNSQDEIKSFLKKLKAPQSLEFRDSELKDTLEEFSGLNDQLDKLRDRLEELGDERTGLVLQPLWWVIERSRRPGSEPYEAVILEQVPAVMPVWREYIKVLASLGYHTGTQLMHTEAFGVPQTRRRAVLMARLDRTAHLNRVELRPGDFPEVPERHQRYQPGSRPAPRSKAGNAADTLPLETSGESADEPTKDPWVSMERSLGSARKIAERLEPELELPARPAFTVISNYGTGGDPEARGRRDHDAPSATITGKVSRNRLVRKGTDENLDRFSFAEAGVLQTFPVAYPWDGNDVSQQIGNAVPPRLALHVLRHVLGPELSGKEAKARLEQDAEKLERWKPGPPVQPGGHRELKGHPLTGR
ncbi:DNA cytosine methyltransferase [Streptomyces peucetius]|uniref:DNA (cytosine-5-)-methyltransferase n=1 Tax=Streptomyces peucetius TaxID=1950 RepID=A0ABY6I6E1_STRPE|nr:DNA cytosine methyltransferase [Streptomyces peucetius]UYQ62304.1 DNA cytosine methyltransferase [Streptomyces peucetius]